MADGFVLHGWVMAWFGVVWREKAKGKGQEDGVGFVVRILMWRGLAWFGMVRRGLAWVEGTRGRLEGSGGAERLKRCGNLSFFVAGAEAATLESARGQRARGWVVVKQVGSPMMIFLPFFSGR